MISPVEVFVPLSVNVPAPAFVKAAAEDPFEITPVIELAALLVTVIVPSDLIFAAVSPAVVNVISAKSFVPPIAPDTPMSLVPELIVTVLAVAPSLSIVDVKVISSSLLVIVLSALN